MLEDIPLGGNSLYAPIPDPTPAPKEAVHGTQETKDEGRQEGKDVQGDAGVQGGKPAVGIEDRPQGDVASTGQGDRDERKRSEQEKLEAELRQQAEEARQRDLLAGFQPYKIRVTLRDGRGSYLDMICTQPWSQWLANFRAWQGIAHDKGYIPAEAVALIVHLDASGQPATLGENVVAFRKPGA